MLPHELSGLAPVRAAEQTKAQPPRPLPQSSDPRPEQGPSPCPRLKPTQVCTKLAPFWPFYAVLRHAVPASFPCELPLERALAPHLSARAVRAAWACVFLAITAAQLGAQPGALLNLRELDASPMVAAYGCVGQARDPGATSA